ncbi:hypothetical protein EOL73_00815 [Candidatus Saccharibacteria bacterium]|nr:hypothetical protein [Candidatus Saccharibacteria bacterium]NCU40285.1 hypothetical protein [Candidatus Saccharibacteria bacterium]
MKVKILYKEQMDYTRLVEDWLRDFKRQTGRDLEKIDPESREGVSLCRTYDILEFPSIIALGDDGTLQNYWRGIILPTINEVNYYAKDS